MNTPNEEIVSCPNCLVCCIKRSDSNDASIVICRVCGKEVRLNELRK
jgi:hypothetical protein